MIDTTTDTWKAVREWAERRIEGHRDALENANDDETRGRLKELRELLAQTKPPPEFPVETTGYDV